MKKRFIAFLLAVMTVCMSVPFSASAADAFVFSKRTESVFIRDPFVLVHDGLYYMYGTGAAQGKGYGCYVSRDLQRWAGPFNVFTADADFDGAADFWAPECHAYNGKFYLFATYRSGTTGHRGVSVFCADDPLGPFREITDGHITPHDRDSIDGTLYVENGVPYMVYVDEWTSTDDGVGRMAAAQMSGDLTHFVSEPKELFRADAPHWKPHKITDGPFLYRSKTGRLMMLWSNGSPEGYCVALASTRSGIGGVWRQHLARLFVRDGKKYMLDGGHGMLFTDLHGQLMLAIHSPNDGTDILTTAKFLPVTDKGYTLTLHETPTLRTALLRAVDRFLSLFV